MRATWFTSIHTCGWERARQVRRGGQKAWRARRSAPPPPTRGAPAGRSGERSACAAGPPPPLQKRRTCQSPRRGWPVSVDSATTAPQKPRTCQPPGPAATPRTRTPAASAKRTCQSPRRGWPVSVDSAVMTYGAWMSAMAASPRRPGSLR